MFYAIHARSKTANRAQRFLDEDELKGRRTTDLKLAERKAQAFAEGLNKRRMMGVSDWRAEVSLIDSPFRPL
jgi:hypothetical protein